jgi:hypothetical protein
VSLSTFFERIDDYAEEKKKPRSIAEDKRLFAYTSRNRSASCVPDLTDDHVRASTSLKARPSSPTAPWRCCRR